MSLQQNLTKAVAQNDVKDVDVAAMVTLRLGLMHFGQPPNKQP